MNPNAITNWLASDINPDGLNKDECKQLGKCVFCSLPVLYEDFKDELSRREYEISGICQKCQDGIFGGDDE